jgi:hypothetical protein
MSCGFWNGTHYWCKVHKKVNGLQGISWLHNNQENQGIAQLISSQNAKDIAGPSPYTSWVMYSQGWTPTEDEYINEAIDKIKVGHPKVKGNMPFTHLPKLLAKGNTILNPTNSSQKESVKLTSKKMEPGQENTILDQTNSSQKVWVKLAPKKKEPNPKKNIIKLKLNKPLANQLASQTDSPSAPCRSGNSSNVNLKDTQPLVPIKSRDN